LARPAVPFRPPVALARCGAQGTWVYLVGLPAYLLNTRSQAPIALTWVDATGFGVWAAGLVCQAIADGQKARFREAAANRDAFIRSGMWALSRHPNYLSEIVLHCGLALVAANGLPAGERRLAVVPPLFTAMLLLCVSGVPPLEKHAVQNWGHLPEYQAYVARTGILLPYPSSVLHAVTGGGRGKERGDAAAAGRSTPSTRPKLN
jgi:steroid 5-alpha reductase family enzyme